MRGRFQPIQLSNQLEVAAENFDKEGNWSPLLITTISKDKDEHTKLAHKVVEVVHRANGKVCVTLLQYIVEKRESSHAQVQLVAKKRAGENFQQTVYVKSILEKFIYPIDVLTSLNDKIITIEPICKVQ